MLFCQLAQAKSLREIVQGLLCCEGKLQHLGVREAPKRATLSYANAHRPWKLFEAVFYQLLEQCQQVAPSRTKFRFHNKLLLLDATVIELCVTMFDWARFRRTKGAIKLHLLLDHDGYLPVFAHLKDVAELLLGVRASITAEDHNGQTALQWAAENGKKEVVELLLANKAEIDARSSNGRTPLHLAVINGHKDVVELLLANKADVNAQDKRNLTALH
jgi:hypothetical protein